MKNKFIDLIRNIKITNRLIISLLLFVFLIETIVFILSFKFTENIISNYSEDYAKTSLYSTEKNINTLIDSFNITMLDMLVSNEIYNTYYENEGDYSALNTKYEKLIPKFIEESKVVSHIVLYLNDGSKLVYGKQAVSLQLPKDNEVLKSGWIGQKYDIENNNYIVYSKEICHFSTGYKIGTMFLYVNTKEFISTYNTSVPNGGYAYIITDTGQIISNDNINQNFLLPLNNHNIEDGFFEYVDIHNKKMVVFVNTIISKSGNVPKNWKYVIVIPYENFGNSVVYLSSLLIIMAIFIFIGSSVFVIYMTKLVNKRLFHLKTKIDMFATNINYTSTEPKSKVSDEIYMIDKSFDDMCIQIRELMRKNEEYQNIQKNMELRILQEQINPHFIYNTLDTISWMAKIKHEDAIEEIISALSSLLKISLSSGNRYITVREEMMHIKNFIAIMNIRFPDLYTVDYEIDDTLLNERMIKIVLQPIVENSIKHGFSDRDNGGKIKIKAYRTEKGIIFEVIDNGIGFDLETVFEKKNKFTRVRPYGIRNVDERIKLEYGDEYGLVYNSIPGEGTCVRISLGYSDTN